MRNWLVFGGAARAWLLLYLVWSTAGMLWGSQRDEEDELKARIQELEKRLEQLETKDEAPASERTVNVEELRRQLDILAEEVERMRAGEQKIELSEAEKRGLGLAPSAGATYERRQGFSLSGYGEMLYENRDDQNESGLASSDDTRLDFLRHVFYMGYRFSDKLIFNSEIEVEHANEIGVEFAYIDFLANEHIGLRGGMLLLPMGLTNEFHEPNVFLGAKRPETETRIIPSTWRENGFGVVGTAGILNYRAYVVNGLNAANFSASGIRGGRQKGSQARAQDLAFVGRLDVNPTPGVFFGGSLYRGGSDQGQFEVSGRKLSVDTTIGEVHGQVQVRGLDLRGLYAQAQLDDVAGLNAALDRSGSQAIAETMEGGYLQFGYNVLSQHTERFRLTPYYRLEMVDTQSELPAGFTSNEAQDGTFHTLGFEFRPIHGVVVKTDYQWIRNEANTGLNQFNVNLGYAF